MKGVLVSKVHGEKNVHIFQRFWNLYGTEGRGADIGRVLEEHVFIRNESAIERFNCETIGLVQGKVACDKDNDVPDLGMILTEARRRLAYDCMPGGRILSIP